MDLKSERDGHKESEQENKQLIDICKAVGIWDIMGKKWSLNILKSLGTRKAMRFDELKRVLPGITSNVLAKKLSQLE